MEENHKELFASSFGAGFILGAVFTLLAFFFLATRKGRELAKKIDFSDFDLAKLDEFLENEILHQNQSKDLVINKDDGSETLKPTTDGENQSTPTSTLGRRFFYRRKI